MKVGKVKTMANLAASTARTHSTKLAKSLEVAVEKGVEKAAKSDDADISAFAQKTLPTLQHHLTAAKDLKKSLAM